MTGFDSGVFAQAAGGIFIISGDGLVQLANPAFGRLAGSQDATLIGLPWRVFVHPDDAATIEETICEIRNSVYSTRTVSMRLQPTGSSPVWTIASFARMSAGAGSMDVIVQVQVIDSLMQTLGALQKSEIRWKYALDSAYQGVWDHDFNLEEFFYSATWRKIRGLAAHTPVDGSLEKWMEGVHPDDRAHVLACIHQQNEGLVNFHVFQYRERHADGHWVWIESRGSSVEWDADGKPTRIIGTDTDITERKRDEATLAEISRKLRLALDVSKIGVFDFNLDTGEALWDERMLQIYGLDRPQSRYSPVDWEKLVHPQDLATASANVAAGISENRPFVNAFRIVLEDGTMRSIRSNAAPYTDAEGASRLIGANWDVTEDVALQAELAKAKTLAEARNQELEAARVRIEYNALHDHLTGLPNRRYLDQRLDEWVVDPMRNSAILHIDLDRFKQINDTLGHQAGDAMLSHTALTLKRFAQDDDFVARIGGDEFVVLCGPGRNKTDVVALTDAIITALRQPVPYEGHLCRFGASAGIAWAGDETHDAKQSLMNADIALYRAKGLGRNRYEFFTKQLQTQIHHAKRTADEIMKGLEEHEFVPYYQPQFCARTLEISGVETLARWNHPVHGVLAPAYFMKVAEDMNALSAIDRSIAEQALGDFNDWERMGLGIDRFSVNVSSRRLREPGLIDSLKALQIRPGILSFELLESIFLDDLEDSVTETISVLKQLGIDIEIDDFGTGHASIVGLLKLSPSRLKIDRVLVEPIKESAEQRRLVGSIIDIGHSLHIDVVAEGVETLAHADILRDLGCDILQGFAFAKPMSKVDLEVFARSGHWRQSPLPTQPSRPEADRDSAA
ncbi:sensor domain-containing protein [Pararhizobium antarcticum]|uniref:sensor domain-containing protein n=1 Tax=Pararhizobium antarcticum TaxID=1798805 RepID=UPI001587B30C|nr:bifunctional diguanylate cyclase/phosphodiesterase [Pararhizobium antarcticum]